MQSTVTEAAIPTVRAVALAYAGSVNRSWKLLSVKVRTTALVNSSTLKNAVDSRANSAAK